jgi:hypothetical protein
MKDEMCIIVHTEYQVVMDYFLKTSDPQMRRTLKRTQKYKMGDISKGVANTL